MSVFRVVSVGRLRISCVFMLVYVDFRLCLFVYVSIKSTTLKKMQIYWETERNARGSLRNRSDKEREDKKGEH